jgi:hypothetical protein
VKRNGDGWSRNASARKKPHIGRSLSTRNTTESRNLFPSTSSDSRSGRVQQRKGLRWLTDRIWDREGAQSDG